MFRPNTTADLNEFPALGTPPTLNRANVPTNSTPSLASRMASYASTASNGFPPLQQHDMDALDFKNSMGLSRNNFEDLAPSSNNRNIPPRSFSMDEFPALGRPTAPLESAGKPEQWLDYANLREQGGILSLLKTCFFFLIINLSL